MIETYRVGSKVKQKVLCNLGRFVSLQAALENEQKNLVSAERYLERISTRMPVHGGVVHTRREIQGIRLYEQGCKVARMQENLRKIQEVINTKGSPANQASL